MLFEATAEIVSPYTQNQVQTAVGMLVFVQNWMDGVPAYDAAEISDLKHCFNSMFTMLGPRSVEAAEVLQAIDRGFRAANEATPDRRAMEAEMSALAKATALGILQGPLADIVRGYLKRNLERMRSILGMGAFPA